MSSDKLTLGFYIANGVVECSANLRTKFVSLIKSYHSKTELNRGLTS